ncbi:MAG: ABC transporter permease [Flavobacteriales bacterium]|nr:ABC transporter permease [Flavobacteriales bacterium]
MDRDQFIEILQVLMKNPIRTILSGIGVSWGVAMILITVAAVTGLENGISQDFAGRAQNSMFLWTQSTSMAYQGFKEGRRFELRNADVDYIRATVTEVELISPRNQLGGYQGSNNVSYQNKTGAFNIYGDTPDYIKIEPIKIWKGRYINQLDMQEQRKVCVIGENVYKALFGKDEAIGKDIRIGGLNFKVIGVYKSVKKGEDADEDTQSIFVPYTTFQKAFNYGDMVGWLSILLDESVQSEEAVNKLLAALKQRKKVHPADPRAFGYWTVAEEVEEINSVFSALGIVSFVFGGLALLAGVIGIVNIMMVNVKERIKEFGIRRALGATPMQILIQVITETLFLTLFFGLIALTVSVGLIETLSAALDSMGDTGTFTNPSIDYRIALYTVITAIVMGLLAGLLPAIISINVRPVDALRTE